MTQPILHGTAVTHARLTALVHGRDDLQVVAAHESRSAANHGVLVDVEMGDPTRGSGRVGAGRVAVTVDRAGRAEGVKVGVAPFVHTGRRIAKSAIEALFVNGVSPDSMLGRHGCAKGWERTAWTSGP